MMTLRTFIWLMLFSTAVYAQEVAVIVHKWDNSIGFYDANTGQQLAKVEVGVKPHEMALSADKRLAYITNYGVNSCTQTEEGGNTISIIDLAERRKLGQKVVKFSLRDWRPALEIKTASRPDPIVILKVAGEKMRR
ncbi:MAG: YncE family protein [Blastocatellia bacterium]